MLCSVYFLETYFFEWESDKDWDKEKEIFHQLLQPANGHGAWDWSGLSLGPGTSSASSMRVQVSEQRGSLASLNTSLGRELPHMSWDVNTRSDMRLSVEGAQPAWPQSRMKTISFMIINFIFKSYLFLFLKSPGRETEREGQRERERICFILLVDSPGDHSSQIWGRLKPGSRHAILVPRWVVEP